jgi:hypothetical protein
VALASAGSFTVVVPVGSERLNTVLEPWASASLTVAPESLATDRSTSVWPPIATPGGVTVSPAPTFSLTTKCGVGLGGRVWVWLVLELVVVVLDVLVAGAVDVVLGAAVDVLLGTAADVDVEASVEDELAAGAVVDEAELEWLLEPHAATSSAGATAAQIRLSIDPA